MTGRRALGVVGAGALLLAALTGFVGSSGASASDTLSFFAGTGTQGTPTPGPATSSNLKGPNGVAVDPSGNVYIADTGNHLVLKVTPGGTLSFFAGTGTGGAPTPGPATSSNLRYPNSVAVDTAGNVYIADTGNNVVEKVTPGGTLSIVAGTGVAAMPTPGPATSSDLMYPAGVALDASGNLYIADKWAQMVEKVTPGGTLSIFAGTGTPGTPTPGPATSSDLQLPVGIAVDASGNVYFADVFPGPMVLKVTPGGTLSIFAGTGTQGPPTAGPATSSDLSYPWGVAVDASGNVYIADAGNSRVEKVGSAATAPDAPTGVIGSAGDGSVTVSWDPPSSDGGSPITGYTVTAAPGGATCTTTGATTCVVTGLTNGAGFTFTVTATSAVGTSSPSSPTATVTPIAGAGIEPRFSG